MFKEHKNFVMDCKFTYENNIFASAGLDSIIKFYSPQSK